MPWLKLKLLVDDARAQASLVASGRVGKGVDAEEVR